MKRYYHLIGIVILVIILVKIDFHKITACLLSLNYKLFILINLLIIPSLFLKAYRWRYLLKLQRITYPIRDSFLSYLGSVYAGMVTPGRIGEALRAVYLKKEKGIQLSKGLASVAFDRLLDIYMLSALGCLGLWYFLNKTNARVGLLIFLAVFVVIPIILILNKSFLEKVVKIIYRFMVSGLDRRFFEGQVKEFLDSFKEMIGVRIYLPLALTVLAYLVYFWQSYLLAHLIPVDISYMTIVFFVSIASLVSILPISILGLGTREAVFIYLFSLIGFGAEKAVMYSFLLFFSFYITGGLIGFFGWLIKGRDNRVPA